MTIVSGLTKFDILGNVFKSLEQESSTAKELHKYIDEMR